MQLLRGFPSREQVDELNSRILNNQVLQRTLAIQYRQMSASSHQLPRFEDTGFRVYSQTDEDGLLLYLFSLLGTTNKVCVELAFRSPHGANTTNLICNCGWSGLLIEGDRARAEQARRFFETHEDTFIYSPKVVSSWVTAENVNDLFREHEVTGEVDLFSLDVDGVDYWLWKSLDVIQPRVVIVEYQDMWGSEKSVTIPYQADFVCSDLNSRYFGASLPAFVKLGRAKGYRLVGCNKYGFNAFFVRIGIGDEVLPEISADQCMKHPKVKYDQRTFLPAVMNRDWVEV